MPSKALTFSSTSRNDWKQGHDFVVKALSMRAASAGQCSTESVYPGIGTWCQTTHEQREQLELLLLLLHNGAER